MKLNFQPNSVSHYWITALWCAIGAILFGAIAVISCWIRKCRSSYRKKPKRHVRRAQSAAEFNSGDITAAQKRSIFKGRSASSEQDHSEGEQSEKSALVGPKLELFARILLNRSFSSTQDSSSTSSTRDNLSPNRHNLKFQYSALDSGNGSFERNPRERAHRERSFNACQEWIKNTQGRYEIIAHLDNIGCRNNKNWFLLNDTTVRTDRLMTLLPIPSDCIALDEMSPSDSPKSILMELLASLQHPYIYPVLDLGFLYSEQTNYACLVMPFNSRGSLKDLIYKSQWNDAWNRKYTRKSTCLPLSQVQRLGRQILEALLFLRERGFPSHSHLHSGNVILQNGVARLSGLENGLLGLNSRMSTVVWSRNITDLEYMDIVCFGHLLFEMCTGYELNVPYPSPGHFQLDLDRYPQVVDVLQLIFEPQDNRLPTLEDLVLCDFFRNIDLRELRGPSVSSFKHALSSSTLNLLNAVRRRQGASLNGSYSEGSSPCTPPSTPRDRRVASYDIDSFDISTDSDGILDEIVITTSDLDISKYGLLNSNSSPIHFCDNSALSDSGVPQATVSRSMSDDPDGPIQSCSNQHITNSYASKNSKSRRMEYSMRGMKLGNSSNPSQDSAFGSMTDGELSVASSSIRISSFQSMSSPIDEDVEDTITGLPGPISFASTTPNRELQCKIAQSASETSLSKKRSARNVITIADSSVQALDPPKILVNDGNAFYTTSPSRAFGTTEVFSQKYRVCSFEDMSSRKGLLKTVNKQNFRSLEEERRIDSAFTPIDKQSGVQAHSFDSSRLLVNNTEKFKKLTHVTFTRKINTTADRHLTWRNSILARKNDLIRSNENLNDHNSYGGHSRGMHMARDLSSSGRPLDKRVYSTTELYAATHFDADRSSSFNDGIRSNPRKSSSVRYLPNLTNLKQTAINDYDGGGGEEKHFTKQSKQSKIKKFNDDNSSNGTDTSSNASSPTHREICQFLGGIEPDTRTTDEKVPLLDGMEMSPISPVETDAML